MEGCIECITCYAKQYVCAYKNTNLHKFRNSLVIIGGILNSRSSQGHSIAGHSIRLDVNYYSKHMIPLNEVQVILTFH